MPRRSASPTKTLGGRRQERERERRAQQDLRFEADVGREIARLCPRCPETRAAAIARHTAARGSGRVGRSAAGRALDPGAITLAVTASVRHEDTRYDELLMSGLDRAEARELVREETDRIIDGWTRESSASDCQGASNR